MRSLLAIATRKDQKQKKKLVKKKALDSSKTSQLPVRRVGRPPNAIKKEKVNVVKALTEVTWKKVVEKYYQEAKEYEAFFNTQKTQKSSQAAEDDDSTNEAMYDAKKGKKPGRPDNLKQNIDTFAKHCEKFYTVTLLDKNNVHQNGKAISKDV